MGMGGMGGGSGGIGAAFGGILDAFGNMAKAHNQNSLATEQRNRANSLATQSANTVAPALQKEFQQALQTKQMLAANGIPNIAKYNSDLDAHLANSIAQVQNIGGSGDAVLATLASLGKNNDASHLALDEQEGQARSNNMNNLVNTMWGIGAEKDNNDVIKREQQKRLNAQSGALENASTTNQFQAKNKNTDATTGLISSVYNLAGGIAGGGGTAKAGTNGGSQDNSSASPKSMFVTDQFKNGSKSTIYMDPSGKGEFHDFNNFPDIKKWSDAEQQQDMPSYKPAP